MPSPLSLRRYHQETLAHSHSHAQLVFGLSGLLDFEVEGLGCRVGPQALAVVPPDSHHACASREGSLCLVLDVPDRPWLEERLGPHAGPSLALLEKPGHLRLDGHQQQLVDWLARSRLDDALIAAQGSALLLASLTQGAASMPAERLPLAAIDAHIDRHCAQPLQVADLARLCGLSVARFHARFLAETGHTPMDHLRKRRLQRARALLEGSTLAVGEVAARVGYASQSAFTAALSRELGVTPRQLRREARDKTLEPRDR